jgi:hypothetical protein
MTTWWAEELSKIEIKMPKKKKVVVPKSGWD